jgi:hypothetical protein
MLLAVVFLGGPSTSKSGRDREKALRIVYCSVGDAMMGMS